MRKILLSMTVLLGWLVASMAHAITVTFNGVEYPVDSFTITQGPTGAVITTTGTGNGDAGGGDTGGGDTGGGDTGGGDTGGGDTGGGDTGGGDTGGACVETSTLRCGSINWASPGGRLRSAVPGTTVTQSWQFTTTSNPNYAGDISIVETTGFESVTRRIWISTEPGGAALTNARCSSEGNSLQIIKWGQSAMFLRCPLQTNTTYFLNLKNASGCSAASNCGYYRATTTNGRP